jgi:hypothetical protein
MPTTRIFLNRQTSLRQILRLQPIRSSMQLYGTGGSMTKLTVILAVLAASFGLGPSRIAKAADMAVSPLTGAQAQDCGPCGCLHVTYVYHRELRTTYGAGFDPRNFDTAVPHFYFGPMHAFPRYTADCPPHG